MERSIQSASCRHSLMGGPKMHCFYAISKRYAETKRKLHYATCLDSKGFQKGKLKTTTVEC